MNYPCPRLKRELEKAYAEDEQIRTDDVKSYFDQLSEHTGKTMKTITDVEFLYNTLEIEVKFE